MKIGLLLLILASLAACDYLPVSMPPNGNYSVTNLQETDTPYMTTITDTLTFCRKNTLLHLDLQMQTYQQILPDSACPLLQPFKDSGTWHMSTYSDAMVVDSVSYEMIDSGKNKFVLDFGVPRNGSLALFGETFQQQ